MDIGDKKGEDNSGISGGGTLERRSLPAAERAPPPKTKSTGSGRQGVTRRQTDLGGFPEVFGLSIRDRLGFGTGLVHSSLK